MEAKKISLQNINEFSLQEIFEKVSNHLISQNKKSQFNIMEMNKRPKITSGNDCYYRIENLKCAAGCLISDEEYKVEFEKNIFDDLCRKFFPNTRTEIILFVRDLQIIHDKNPVGWWKDELIYLGNKNGLNCEFISRL